MTITLSKGADALTLPEDLFWADEFDWSPVSQGLARSTTGALLVDIAVRTGGRSITLRGEGDTAWITRADLKTLSAWSKLPGQRFALDLRGQPFTVIFDHGTNDATTAINQAAVVAFSDISDTDFYCSLVLRFLEI